MNLDFDTFKPLISALETAGLPVLSTVLAVAFGPAGIVVGPALGVLVPMINRALGLDEDATPQQAADAIAADPDAAKDKLAAVQEDHSYLLQSAKQVQDFTLAAQGQQTALIALDEQSPSIFLRGWRPAAAWICVTALGLDTVVIPTAAWVAALYGRTLPAPPDTTALLALLTALLGLGAMRSFDKAKGTTPVKSPVIVPPIAPKRVAR